MLALTMGDPAGIGGEITIKAWRALRDTGPAFLLIADPDWLRRQPGAAGLSIGMPADAAAAAPMFAEALPLLTLDLAKQSSPGRPDRANAAAVTGSIARAVSLALDGSVRGIVTNPISKAVLQEAGFAYPGHTEYLGALVGTPGAEVMMLAGPSLRVVPVTVHVSLRRALDTLTSEAIVRVARTTRDALRRDFGIGSPRLAIAGLNPHAGEAGHMGDEETSLIEPAIAILRAEGIDVTGPMPPDTMFTPRARSRYDAAICMYHDQALIPLKTLDMERGVNITLGLPIVRTSPDHGTAFDISGRGEADPTSLIEAIRLADRIARNRSAV
jgi:4-hydroxythreonine-4-phosphate dehydrogenase